MKSMTFETKDDGYCSSECSNMSECSMDSMESIISGIEALVVETMKISILVALMPRLNPDPRADTIQGTIRMVIRTHFLT